VDKHFPDVRVALFVQLEDFKPDSKVNRAVDEMRNGRTKRRRIVSPEGAYRVRLFLSRTRSRSIRGKTAIEATVKLLTTAVSAVQYPARPYGHRRLFEELLQRHLVFSVLFFLPHDEMLKDEQKRFSLLFKEGYKMMFTYTSSFS
jgi:hypothetical protein